MADLSISVGDRLNIGSILGRSYTILLGNLSSFLVIALVTMSPLYVLYIWLGYDFGIGLAEGPIDAIFSAVAVGTLAGLISSTLALLATGTIVYGTLCELQGRPANLADLVRRGIETFVPVLLVAVAASVVTSLGLAVLVIPGLIFGVLFWVAVPLAAIERRSPIASLRGSSELTRNYRWPVFGLLVLNLAMVGGLAYAQIAFLDYSPSYLRALLIEWATTSLMNAFWAVATAVTYFDLRRIKEGTETDEIAAVFD